MAVLSLGQDTLRCLGLATVDSPGPKEEMNLDDAKNFVQYEVIHIPYIAHVQMLKKPSVYTIVLNILAQLLYCDAVVFVFLTD